MAKSTLGAHSTLQEWLDYIFAKHPTEIDMGTVRVSSVAKRMSLMELSPAKVITVAGTNGKGSTCALLDSILRQSGQKVGVYSSPHLIRFNERIIINGEEVSDSQLIEAFVAIETAREEISLTFFEYATLTGLYLFKAANLDTILLEVGLGGRLDATNIVDADISVITSIDLDHQEYLGNTRTVVALEKMGICRENRPAIIGEPNFPPLAMQQLKATGIAPFIVGENFTYIQQAFHWQYQGKRTISEIALPQLPLPNAATAIAVVEHYLPDLDEGIIRKGIEAAKVAGRLEVVSEAPLVLLDVAHNPHAARYLNQQLQQYSGKRLFALCGMLKDKDYSSVLNLLSKTIHHWSFVTLDEARGASALELLKSLPKTASADCYDEMNEAWENLQQQISADDVVIVFGSFYTVAGFKLIMSKG
ncbi:bifunctional tetrahydrofolate synthase/dihydrofolate synthase [Parashewanella spongiae]|uniref:Dihydrofolate synthase/folylpolyglutamate synthase n=1 Tax=Parashewanella spongiae TaxID=342950 RepID=A0A3A6TV00_9GAMM|nr:bifunctional tetrahydrofolate synthase/dihydrofolate synthase [Parashewanella spongiae]MCL1077709.1 bifunctional tetrahydrofolate synthase/dihydrofolate synthase [Parashewanella spongiae]RJY18094.1 bifunctional tetrahydrofolate synthase/dihydrofolate synthase [Parashewanella spongiae]